MSKRWSKLQSRLYNLMDPSVGFQIHCAIYEMNSNDGHHGCKLPRYFATIGKEIVFDYPGEFDTSHGYEHTVYPWITDMGNISDIIEEYMQTSEEKLMEPFDDDRWGITEILRVCDRRMGKRRLLELSKRDNSDTVQKILTQRLEKYRQDG